KILDTETLRGPVLHLGQQLFPLNSALYQPLTLENYQIQVKNFYPYAAVYQGQLVNQGDKPQNPAVELSLLDKKGKELSISLFSKFPEMKGHLELQGLEASLLWIPKSLGEGKNQLLLFRLPSGELYAQFKSAGSWQKAQLIQRGQVLETGWMDFKFSFNNLVQDSKIERNFKEVKLPKGQEGPPPALHLHLARGGERQSHWLGRGEQVEARLGDKTYQVAYGLKSKPLGFDLYLKDFVMGHYPGTQDPSDYESHVGFFDQKKGEEREEVIAMNQPLVYGGLKLFQASYQLNPNGPDWSVLSVSYDPGIVFKYLGSIILVLGTILIFFFRGIFSKARS
ncbi:MAG: cytochrome c biogenesis protein ResB, partial [Deltaproteobacteria bacterium]|nr:cytochrome c biogenesis protein ResB [Deltaproteobacteria bacterium]